MNAVRFRRAAVAVAAAAVLPLGLAACSDDSSDSASDTSSSAAAPAPEEPTTPATEEPATDGKPFGPGCASVPKDGAGSFDGMAQDPVATAASN
ncbi:fasciclin domain-containing protein, partial [Streptomyces sp. NPDC055749]